VEEYLPLRLLQSPVCRRLVELMLAAAREGCDPGEYLACHDPGDADASVHAFWKALRGQPVRIRGDDYTRHDAMQDLILGFWRRFLHEERRRLVLPGSGATDPSSAARRIQITMDLKALQHWDTGQIVIQIEFAMLAERAAAVVPPVPGRP
jgi:hypothetical protein